MKPVAAGAELPDGDLRNEDADRHTAVVENSIFHLYPVG